MNERQKKKKFRKFILACEGYRKSRERVRRENVEWRKDSRKLRLSFWYGLDSELIPDWQCSNCGYGVADDYVACPHCGSALDWSRARKPSKAFKKFMARL